MSLDETLPNSEMQSVWSCPEWTHSTPKTTRKDNSPIFNVTTVRGSEGQSVATPPTE